METTFAYLKEFGSDAPDDQLNLTIQCGEILYSALPPLFSTILGLTGTLPSPAFQRILDPYDFVYHSELPSTFDKKQVHVSPGRMIRAGGEDGMDGLFEAIADSILDNSKGATLVFLKNRKVIDDLVSFLLIKKCDNVAILDQAESDDKNYNIIAQASSSGRITLSTQFFARYTLTVQSPHISF